jgi:hypothetical protein
MKLGKYSWGVGDRFAHQAEPQLLSLLKARELGLEIIPVWNKSNREHTLIHSEPSGTRAAVDAAVEKLGYTGDYFLDADHINLSNVDRFLGACDFFTLDVADAIGTGATPAEIDGFVDANRKYIGRFSIPGIASPFDTPEDEVRRIASKFLFAIKQAADIYKYIAARKDDFVVEVSMDEVNDAQSPVEMFFILSAIAQCGIPAQTIAPKFTGRFNKGVDYVGDVGQFEREFEQDLLVIDYAVKEFGLPGNLKLSIHSGSDKFSIYPVMGRLIRKYDKGIHVKTAGTTWLEEMIGLAESGGEGLAIAKRIYAEAYDRREALCVPYATVIDIHTENLPRPAEVEGWSGDRLARSLRHVQSDPYYNSDMRQLVHVAFKLAAELGGEFTDALDRNAGIIGRQVFENLYDRHIKLLFGS